MCRLPPAEPVPTWAGSAVFSSVTRTADELSIICPATQAPDHPGTERGWRLLKLIGPFDFGAVGIFASVANPLAHAGVSLLTIGTFDTDYLLVKAEKIDLAMRTLESAGHTISRG